MLDLQYLVRQLTALDWTDQSIAHKYARTLLEDLYPHRAHITRAIQGWSHAELVHITDLSRETTTHYKWFIARDDARRFIVWLHEYKPEHLRRPGYANVAHNHRYAFSSIILHGGLDETAYERRSDPHGALAEMDSRNLVGGDCYSVMPDEIHAMTGILDQTLTLIVQSAPVRNYSEAYDLTTDTVRRYHDFIGQYEHLRASMELLRT